MSEGDREKEKEVVMWAEQRVIEQKKVGKRREEVDARNRPTREGAKSLWNRQQLFTSSLRGE